MQATKATLYHLHALSALHCGTGQSAGVVDLPIARAKATKLPIVPGSSLRGVLRDAVDANARADAEVLFGPRNVTDSTGAFAGALAVGDASLLALPVRSLGGIACYATSRFILSRYVRDLKRAGKPTLLLPPGEDAALVPSGSANRVESEGKSKVVLEDVDLTAQQHDSAEQWAQHLARLLHPEDETSQRDLMARFAILPDDVMDFLSETATEVRARVAICPEKGTAKTGALWYEESLPAESVLWGVLALSSPFKSDDDRTEEELAKLLPKNDPPLQLGGNASVGHGLVRFLTDGIAP